MEPQLQQALINRLLAVADDELILGHRNAEWTGHAPILEEDIALANIAQDELGHAVLLYGIVADLGGDDADTLAMFRDADAFRNVQLVELPKGDWAFTMVRQFSYDAYELALHQRLREGAFRPIADASAKILQEEIYHLRHSHAWVERLGLGTTESNRRMQAALDTLWPYAGQLFVESADAEILVKADYFPALASVQAHWEQIVIPHLEASGLVVPDTAPIDAPRTVHTAHLDALLADMQLVARSDPEATW